MVRFSVITVVLLDNTTVRFRNITLLEVVKQCLQYPLANDTPIKIAIGKDYCLYFNTEILISWVNKQISFKEVEELLKVDDLVRNISQIAINDITIDSGSLWKLKNSYCTLVDDDIYVSTPLDDRFEGV